MSGVAIVLPVYGALGVAKDKLLVPAQTTFSCTVQENSEEVGRINDVAWDKPHTDYCRVVVGTLYTVCTEHCPGR